MAMAPNNQNVLIGRGEVLIDVFDANGVEQGYQHMGNCDVCELTANVNEITLNSSMTGIGSTYADDIVSLDWNIRIQGQEFHKERMQLLFMGNLGTLVQAANAAIADQNLGTAVMAKKGAIIDTGVRQITVTAVKQGATPLTLGTDYSVFDAKAGLIRVLDTFTGTEGDQLTWSGSCVAIAGLDTVDAGSRLTINGRIKVIPHNPRGPQGELVVFNASLRPDGAIGIISSQYASASLVGKATDDSAGTHGGSTLFPTHRMIYRAA